MSNSLPRHFPDDSSSWLREWIDGKTHFSYFRLRQVLTGSAQVSQRTQSRVVFAGIGLSIRPLETGAGWKKSIELTKQDIEDGDQKKCIAAAFSGAFDELMTHHLFPISDCEVVLTFFSYDKPQSSRTAFWQAGREALRQALQHPGGVGMTEAAEIFEFVSKG